MTYIVLYLGIGALIAISTLLGNRASYQDMIPIMLIWPFILTVQAFLLANELTGRFLDRIFR